MKQILFICALLALSLTTTAQTQAKLGPADGAELKPADLTRIKVGDKAPDFTLEDQDGKSVTLSSYRNQKAIVLVFYRGYWWPYCATQLGKLKAVLDQQQQQSVEILAVSVDPRDKLVVMRDKLKDQPGINFPMLSDPDHRVIDRYGLLNEQARRPVPHPATVIIDRQGIVRWKFIEVDYKVRPSNEDVLAELKKLGLKKQ